MTTTTAPAGADFVPCDTRELVRQLGAVNILSISGGRVGHRATGVTLPVSHGYSVTVDLAADDTYTVSRVQTRGGRVFMHGTRTGVYCDEVAQAAYFASCHVSYSRTEWMAQR